MDCICRHRTLRATLSPNPDSWLRFRLSLKLCFGVTFTVWSVHLLPRVHFCCLWQTTQRSEIPCRRPRASTAEAHSIPVCSPHAMPLVRHLGGVPLFPRGHPVPTGISQTSEGRQPQFPRWCVFCLQGQIPPWPIACSPATWLHSTIDLHNVQNYLKSFHFPYPSCVWLSQFTGFISLLALTEF